MASPNNDEGKPSGLSELEALTHYRREVEAELTGVILPFYVRHGRDEVAGGFHGEIDEHGTPSTESPRAVVLYSRILWTFARAYRLLGDETYREVADQASDYVLSYFQDHRHGGFYWTVDRDGRALRTVKETYGQSFAIYALAEHYLATGNGPSLEAAVRTYRCLHQYTHDHRFGGYFEARRQNWRSSWRLLVSPSASRGRKTVNIHLHLMEAYTLLYAAWKDAGLRQDLQEVVHHMLTAFYAPEQECFDQVCDRAWRRLPTPLSYGHDLEAVWLLGEAAVALADNGLMRRVQEITVTVARAVAAHGQGEDGAVFLAGDVAGPTDRTRIWWPQAESMVGFFYAYEISHSLEFLNASLACWRFCQAELSDPGGGEWLVAPAGEPGALYRYKVGPWKGPYHNGRACMEIMVRTLGGSKTLDPQHVVS